MHILKYIEIKTGMTEKTLMKIKIILTISVSMRFQYNTHFYHKSERKVHQAFWIRCDI